MRVNLAIDPSRIHFHDLGHKKQRDSVWGRNASAACEKLNGSSDAAALQAAIVTRIKEAHTSAEIRIPLRHPRHTVCSSGRTALRCYFQSN
jgi:hypothetical protein